jgi:UDP-N-acetylglucosamine:LPS N-acetylglucosamine transferase
MLFTCQYGSGHKMATQSIVESLPDCEVQVVDIYNEPLASLDPMRSWIPALSNERIYNDWIKKEKNQLLNLAGKIAPKMLLLQEEKIQELLIQSISKAKPDLLISCVPLVNSALLAAADELDIPLLVVTTDIDISAFCYGLPEDLKEHKSHFRLTVPYDPADWNPLFGSYFPPSLQAAFQYSFGYPTRRAFSETPTRAILNQLRAEYEIQKDENVILIMMGGNAGHASRSYADLLMQMDDEALDRIVGKGNSRNKIHLICLCGDTTLPENKNFMESLNASSSRVRIHGCPGTPKIGELVSLPELSVVISKPGGSTVNEMIKRRVPMIYHINKHPLDWEKGNIEYGESRGLGRRFLISNSDDLSDFTDLLSETFALRKSMLSGQIPVPEANIDFASNLRKTVQEMISPSRNRDPLLRG